MRKEFIVFSFFACRLWGNQLEDIIFQELHFPGGMQYTLHKVDMNA